MDSKLSENERRLLELIMDNHIYSMKDLEKQTGWSYPTLKKAVTGLKQRGLVYVNPDRSERVSLPPKKEVAK